MPRLVSPPATLLLLALFVLTVAGYVLVPADAVLPVRWGLAGEVATTMPRNLALLQMPFATALVWAVAYLIGRSGNAERAARAAAALRWAPPAATALFVAIQLVIVLVGLGVAVPFLQAA